MIDNFALKLYNNNVDRVAPDKDRNLTIFPHFNTKVVYEKVVNMGKFRDLTGRKFGRLTVVKRVENSHRNTIRYLCECECGNTKIVEAEALTKGKTKSCGCYNQEIRLKSRLIDITGQRFGRLTAIKYLGRRKWLCQCDCGNTCIVNKQCLKSGGTKSCGCLQSETASKYMSTHKLSKNRLYSVWSKMKYRCDNINDKEYHNYGARGITVCDEWKNDFKAFYDWAIQNGYDETAPRGKYTIDRINVNGNYEPLNCRLVDIKINSNNKRNNRYINYNGVTKTLKQWSEEMNIDRKTISGRLDRGWSVEDALTKKPMRRK